MLSRLAGSDVLGKKSLRLAAWVWLHGGKPGASLKPYDCDRDCGVEPELNNGRRALRGCTRVDLPDVEWEIDPEELGFYMGREADRRLHLKVSDWQRPGEDIDEGCPGGYQRAPLLGPLNRFYRRRTEGGGRVSNPFFDACDDALILSAILYLEHEEERAHCEWLRCDNELMRAEANRGS